MSSRRGRSGTMGVAAVVAAGVLVLGCGAGSDGGGGGGSGGVGGGGAAAGAAGAGGDVGGSGGSSLPACLPAEGPGAPDTDVWVDDPYQATVTIDAAASCQRSYQLATTAPLRDDLPANPRTIVEQPGWSVLRSGHDMFDALYALALDELREDSVDTIADAAFNGGQPIACPFGGCFETGRLWKYVWTRDTAYAVLLGIGELDPRRAANSLLFKLSERRAGGDEQIVQDTGTGGSYPISTDRAIWALGAWELLKFLDGADRDAFLDRAYQATAHTAEHDRLVIYDPTDGLYRGEQSFLDWREQSYPDWTADDPVQIGMSKSLSTNVAHQQLLWVAAELAAEKGLSAQSSKYQGWADALASSIAQRFTLSSSGMLSSFITTSLDPSPVERFDLLGSALAVLAGIGSEASRAAVVAGYPHLPKGAPVIFPQQQLTPIYHNRAMWPFATALWARAGAQVGNAAAVTHAARSLIRGAALNLSNMESFEAVSGAPWLDDGPYSGPVVSSQRQLWSVAGYLSLVHQVLFGMQATQTAIRFAPFVPRALRNTLFVGADRIALSALPYRGGRLYVTLELGPADGASAGALTASSVHLDGAVVGSDFIESSVLGGDHLFEITLAPDGAASDNITEISEAEISDYHNLYGPRSPAITGLSLVSDRLSVGIDLAGESPADVVIDVLRDGQAVATDLPGSTAAWIDQGSGAHATHSYCYSLRTRFLGSNNASQHARPVCYWGPGDDRIASWDANSFSAVGGQLVQQYGHWHYQGWGEPGDSLTTAALIPSHSGLHYLQLLAGNGAGPVSTGVACGVKRVRVLEGNTTVASGYLMMPQLGGWDSWRGSSFLPVMLDSAKSYTVVIDEDSLAVNMSERAHFATYSGTGGSSGRFNRANVAEVKLLGIELQ